MLEADNKLLKSCCSTSTLLAFKPRQVLLAEQKQQQKSKKMVKKKEQQLNHKAALIYSILNYLQKNGFSKTFKRFLKEAQIEQDNWKTSLDLEDVYSRYLESSRDVDKNSKAHKEQDVTPEKSSGDLSEEAISKKKKKKDKKGLENDEGDGKGESEETAKSKDKKEKHKLRTVSVVEDGQKTKKDSDAIDIPVEDCKTETQKRKKKKEVVVSKKSSDNGQEMVDQGKSLEASEDGTKESKKRKLSASDESGNKNMEKSETGESKRRKTEDLEEAEIGVQQGKLNAEDNGHVDHKEPQKLSNKEVDGITKGDLIQNGLQKSAWQRLARKQRNGSAEPKTAANAFQRVKVDEVKFVDERLQDNSYWAKDGADYGYGAKAQEILGQVKGRGFRHEKTKKKRGSYRGGQIDLQSHSIKFNYDDDE